MEEKKISVKEYLQTVVSGLCEIQVPVKYADSISLPLRNAVGSLEALIAQLDAAEADQSEVKADV